VDYLKVKVETKEEDVLIELAFNEGDSGWLGAGVK
jgi:hypothetical protein